MVEEHYDIIVIGAGPAGLSAAINARIRNRAVLVVDQPYSVSHSALERAARVENYLGLGSSSGPELHRRFLEHAQQMELEIVPGRLGGITYDPGAGCHILLDDAFIAGKSLILATGSPYQASIPEEQEFVGRGLGYCATCDGPLYRNRPVLIVAHGAEAEEEANFMAEICSQVYYLPLKPPQSQLDARIEILAPAKPEKILADSRGVTGLRLSDGREIAAAGLFILGAETAPERLLGELELEENYIKVNRDMATNLPGVFAAGDCTGQPYQIAKAVGEGQVAGLNAARYASRS